VKDIKVGERVAVYDYSRRLTGVVVENTGPSFPGAVLVLLDQKCGDGSCQSRLFSRMQCRRIVPKKRAREFYLCKRPLGLDGWVAYESYPQAIVCAEAAETICVREVKK
jgi:hypothetical protein